MTTTAVCTDGYKITQMEWAIKEEWSYERAFVEANEDRDLLGGFIVPEHIKQLLSERKRRRSYEH